MSRRAKQRSGRFVSRGGDKLEKALEVFGYDPTDNIAADLGANVGGFTDCLLQYGASRVYAVDTGYGVLEWKLRSDERVVTLERNNALHVELPEPVDLVVADVGWTSVIRYTPHALGLLKDDGRCVVLVKPQYEVDKAQLRDGRVDDATSQRAIDRIVQTLSNSGSRVLAQADPDIASRGRNPERFLMLAKA
jgi:23S rRNA (cytidine1920-2'-O)/16S rRNA (cytidine1409-2'-O)-methyltransferase